MTQATDSDFDQPSGVSGTSLRTNINNYFEAINTKNSGATEPSTRFPGMNWIDTSLTPVVWKIRNQANSAWDDFAKIDATTGIEILNKGAPVPGTAIANIFTLAQTIDIAGSAGSLVIKSDRTTGIAASVDLGGHDDGGADTIYASIDVEITDDTDGAETAQLVFRLLRAGVEVSRMTLGADASVVGDMNATTLKQAGTTVAALIEAQKGNVTTNGETGAAVSVPSALSRGERNKFTGSSASTYTINSGTAGNLYPLMNDGSADITFAEGSGVTIVGGTSLGQQKVCTVEYVTATRVFIYGENV